MDYRRIEQEILNPKCNDLKTLLNCLNSIIHYNMPTLDSVSTELLEGNIIEELKNITVDVPIYFGKTLLEFKCVLVDNSGFREHEILLKYRGPKKIVITETKLPYSPLYDKEYESLEELLTSFRLYVDNLTNYFNELERIDRFCSVVDPVHPTFKEDYRRIVLDDRIWLHVEVTPEGTATNVHLIGQFQKWQDKLQSGLLNWDHDKDIVENIMTMFDISEFPVPTNRSMSASGCDDMPVEIPNCSICLCVELPDNVGVPQPLCQYATCGVYFHRMCLFQWLVACAGGRPPAFGVASGACPACLQSITCTERDV